MHTIWQDLRYASRVLGKNPGFTAIAVLTLALGISMNATMFAMVSGYVLRRPPAQDADHVLVVSSVNPGAVFMPDAYPVSAPNYIAWRNANSVFSEVAAADHYRNGSLTIHGQAEALRSAAVSANYFALLGENAELGQTFMEGQDQPGHDHLVVLSHALWVRRFASDPSVVGSTVRLNRENYVVLGVMPANFMLMGYTEQLWTPLTFAATDTTAAAHNDRSLQFLGRLKPGATLAQAQGQFQALARRTQNEFPEIEKGWGVSVRTLPDFLVYGFGIRTALAIVMTTVGFVLLIACGNVAGLLLTRAAGRQKELAVRISLGAGRLDIVRQLLTEGLVIAALGGAVGLLLATWGVKVVRANMQFNEAVAAVPISLDRNVLWFTLGVSLLSALLCGLVPALKASRTDVNRNLKDDSRGSTSGPAHNRLRSIMITGEIALALFLVIGTGLLVRGIFVLEHQKLGFQPDHILTAAVSLDSARYKDAQQQVVLVKDVTARIQSIPGIEDVAATSDLPATGPGTVTFHIEGQTEATSNQPLGTLDEVVSSAYFRAAGITLLRGRAFTEMDDGAAPRVVVVSQQFVQRFLHDQEPLGKRIRLDVSGGKPVWNEIIGVVSDVKTYSEATRSDPAVYEAFLQRPSSAFAFMVRTSRDPNEVAPDLRNAVAQVDAELPLDRVMSMPAVIEQQRRGDVFFSRMLGVFAALALILSVVGIYGLIAYSVTHRTHEIGIRMALGAEKSDVLRIVLRQGFKMAVIGTAIGLVLALPLPKLFESLFFDLHFAEPSLYFIVPVAIIAVAMLATYIPARRATRVDPMVALRYE
jgi:putative ABC transport system permease protein